ncbi:gamma-glutamyltransferase [Thalassotalea mangrovi]|uniref:Glutathione hydrolase proenzyme n=1 Tax=Thalassotalea mangrovi TaxID=2572245 RepID=A0A4U1B6I7_9GAMM|nr:gamma-glutamyltransferase [Thalassotalea mangrovi]TKB45772.1 gamma-glutamyltransferase [Thalassotalea mangrovi]
MLVCLSVLSGCIHDTSMATQKREEGEPEAATGVTEKQVVESKSFMVTAANPLATQAGFNILKNGGSAVDAAIAVQLVLSLVEPQSSGIGGGAFMLYFDKDKGELRTYDGREIAPASATEDMFLDKQGNAVPWIEAVVGGRSVGVPGLIKMMEMAHQQHGKLPWATLFEQAIKLAEQGFIVSPRLARLVQLEINPGLTKLGAANQYFFPNGKPLQAGMVLKNPEFARVLRTVAELGSDAFYHGWIAKDIAAAVQNSAVSPGGLSEQDMANYQAKQRDPVCAPYRAYELCSMAPPSSGGIAVMQILGQLQQFDLSKLSAEDPQAIHLYTQSARLAFADRNRYLADPDFANVPTSQMLSADYLNMRGALIDSEKDMGKASPGEFKNLTRANDNAYELPSTTHMSIVDKDGNAVSMTATIEMAFGSGVMVNGFLLNNQLTDFSRTPEENGVKIANRVEPLKRPRSSMAPMMVFNGDGSLRLVVGSPGGSRIINYVSQTLIGVLDWNMSIQEAINMPRVTHRNDITTLEKGTNLEMLKPALEAMGHEVSIRDLNSGLHGIEVFGSKLVGGADPRREGIVLGE